MKQKADILPARFTEEYTRLELDVDVHRQMNRRTYPLIRIVALLGHGWSFEAAELVVRRDLYLDPANSAIAADGFYDYREARVRTLIDGTGNEELSRQAVRQSILADPAKEVDNAARWVQMRDAHSIEIGKLSSSPEHGKVVVDQTVIVELP